MLSEGFLGKKEYAIRPDKRFVRKLSKLM